MKIISFLITFLFCINSFAAPRAYVDMKDSFFASPTLYVDGKELDFGFFTGFGGLSEAMSSDPKAQAYAESYESRWMWGNIMLWGGLAAAVTYSIAADDFDGGTYWGIFLAGFLPGVLLHGSANVKFIRAINQYNGVYSQESALILSPTPNGMGLTYLF